MISRFRGLPPNGIHFKHSEEIFTLVANAGANAGANARIPRQEVTSVTFARAEIWGKVQTSLLTSTGCRGFVGCMPPTRHSAVPNFGGLRSEFRRRRSDAGLTYDALAEKTGVSRRTLISIENGQSNGSVETWYNIAGALDIDMSDLMRSLYTADK